MSRGEGLDFHRLWVYRYLAMKSDDLVTDTKQNQHEQHEKAGGRPVIAVFVLIAMSVVLFGASVVGAAQKSDEGSGLEGASAPGQNEQILSQVQGVVQDVSVQDVETLEGELAEREEQVEVLEEQLHLLRQALIGIGSQEIAEDVELAVDVTGIDRRSDEFQAHSQAQWLMGYSIGGGENADAFLNTILPCESGTQPDPDRAVGATDDWGRAQINRPVWKARFESLTGANFEANISDPVLNGFMAAHVEQEQGLRAWTCWRIR